MKFGVVTKSTILNRFLLHTLQRKITHLAVITRKINIKLGILKGENWKRACYCYYEFFICNTIYVTQYKVMKKLNPFRV